MPGGHGLRPLAISNLMMGDEPSTRALFRACAECGAGFGEPHWPSCRAGRDTDEPDRSIARAVRICRDRGWAVAEVPGEGMRPCAPSDPGSYVDLDRYYYWLENGPGVLDGNEP
jgi:hypothetical protein